MALFAVPSKKWGPRTNDFCNSLYFNKIQIWLVRGPLSSPSSVPPFLSRFFADAQNDNAFYDPPFGRGMEKKRSCDFRNSLILNLLLNQDLNLGPSD